MPKLLLVNPGNGRCKDKFRDRARRFPAIGLPVIAALTPPDWEVKVVEEEQGEAVNYDERCDVVGISMMTSQALRGYDIADEFRKRGAKVCVGGSHPSVCPDEAALHADSVFLGEAEATWPQFLADYTAGRPQQFYKGAAPTDNWYVAPRRDLVKANTSFSVVPMVATRGCPYTCSFCSVFSVFGRAYRHRPVDEVAAEVEHIVATTGQKNFIFVDDNIIGNPKWSKALFRRLIPLGIRWGGQSTLGVARDPEVVELAAKSGCMSLFLGIESVSKESLRSVRKQFNKVSHYREQIQVFHDNGIVIVSGIIFGFDDDDLDVFERTVEVIHGLNIALPSFSLLTPLPGTDTYRQYKSEGRLLTEDWDRYHGGEVVIRPKKMTPEQLQEGADWAGRQYYSFGKILRRFTSNWQHALYYSILSLSFKAKHYWHPAGRIHVNMTDAERRELRTEFGFDDPMTRDSIGGQGALDLASEFGDPAAGIAASGMGNLGEIPIIGQKQPIRVAV